CRARRREEGCGRARTGFPAPKRSRRRKERARVLSKASQAVKAPAAALEGPLAVVAEPEQAVVDAPREPAHAVLLELQAHRPAATARQVLEPELGGEREGVLAAVVARVRGGPLARGLRARVAADLVHAGEALRELLEDVVAAAEGLEEARDVAQVAVAQPRHVAVAVTPAHV